MIMYIHNLIVNLHDIRESMDGLFVGPHVPHRRIFLFLGEDSRAYKAGKGQANNS